MRALQLKIPPVAQFLVAAILMWLIAISASFAAFRMPGRLLPASILLLASGLVGLAGVRRFVRAGTTVSPLQPETASRLVADGIYRYTRNPMYLALLLALLAWGVLLANWLSFAVIAVFVLSLNTLQIAPEERALAARFGEQYETYRSRVRRWL